MAARKGRSPVAASITQAAIEKATTALIGLPEKPKTNWSLRETIYQLQDTINTALERGYSHQEIAGMLAEQGIRISPTSLKAYMAANSREAGVAPKRRRKMVAATAPEAAPKAEAPKVEVPKAEAPKAESAPEPASAAKKTRATKTGSKAKPAAAPTKTLTSTRGRKAKAAAEPAAPRTGRKKAAATAS